MLGAKKLERMKGAGGHMNLPENVRGKVRGARLLCVNQRIKRGFLLPISAMVVMLALPHGALALVRAGHRGASGILIAGKPVLKMDERSVPLRDALRENLRGGAEPRHDRIVLGEKTWWSRTTFSYINSLLDAGFDHPLEADELPALDEEHTAELHVKMLEQAWLERKKEAILLAEQRDSAAALSSESENTVTARASHAAEVLYSQEKAKREKAMLEKTLLGAVWGTYSRPFLLGGIPKIVQDILSFASPFLVKTMYKYVDPMQGFDSSQHTWRNGLGICAVFFLVQYASSVALHLYFDRVFQVSLQIRAGLVACVYRKALRLSHASRSQKSLGELVNLMSVDVQRMTDLVPYLHNLIWSSPLQIVISMMLLYRLVGVASLVGLAVMIAVMPINAAILLKLRKLQEDNMKEKDKRVKQVSEVLHSIKVIKMFAWEHPLAARIERDRNEEVKRLRKYGYISSLQSIFWNSAPVTVSLATFGAYAGMGNRLDMHIVLPALAIINIMSFPLFVFPLLISAVISGRVAMARLNDFLNLPERDLSHITYTSPLDDVPICLTNVTVGWNISRPIVSNINLQIKKNSLTAIIGPVGSGKSTVIAAMLGDVVALGGTVAAPQHLAYVPQQPWIQNANVRDNILFGRPFDPRRYAATLEACALHADLSKLPDGDQTEIGERGVNLSGGQKQRIALARAVYQNSGSMLLDDVLSALDSHVGAHVLQHCLLNLLANTTRVLVTHNLDVLHAVDQIVVLGEGKVLAQGSIAEVMAQGIDLESVVESLVSQPAADAAKPAADAASASPAAEPLANTHTNPNASSSLVQADASSSSSRHSTPPEEARDALKHTKPEMSGEGETSGKAPVVLKQSAAAEGGGPKRSGSMHQQVLPEARVQGAVTKEIYLTYLRELRYPMLALIGVIGMASQGARNGNDWWLTRWASAPDRERVKFYLGIYALSNVGSSVLFLIRDVTLMLTELQASSALHKRMLDAVMQAPMNFFDSTPVGRVLNRFSNDQESLDSTLPRTLNQLFSCALRVAGTIAMICFVNPIFIVALVPVGYLYWIAQQYYAKSSRELKRIESTAKSPLYSHFGESISGSSIIRASGQDCRFRQENCERVNELNKLFSLINDCNRWLAIRLELCGNGIVTGAALTGVVSRQMGWVTANRASLVGLSLTLALAVTNSLGWMVRMSTETEAQMNAVERVTEYAKIESEETWIREMVFSDYSMRYRADLPDVIRDISLTIKPGEKVGVCGRTGAGKSSLLMALFRMALVSSGKIVIDGRDISEVRLEELRSGLAIVPQEPMLFGGSIAYNLDPFGDFTAQQLWHALAEVQMDGYVKSLAEGLDAPVGEGGGALSVGQRQLLCMARALLRGTRVLVLDEATAAVDEDTDKMIQAAVRRSCKGCTVLTIAHRLNTIMDYDKIMLMSFGSVVEYDSPQALLKNPDSEFSRLVADSKQIMRTRSRELSELQGA